MSDLLLKLRAFIELGRISNLPTTFTNVLVGAAIGVIARGDLHSLKPEWPTILQTWIAIACLYVAGMAMNDLFDASIDARERPGRVIPSGRISHTTILVFINILIVIALALLWQLHVVALLGGAFLVALIVLYNAAHARFTASVILLGLSRAMVYIIAAAAVTAEFDWRIIAIYGGALAMYTTMFSLIARREMRFHTQTTHLRIISLGLPVVALTPALISHDGTMAFAVFPLMALVIAAFFLFRSQIRNAVMMWIATICLVDAMYLGLLNQRLLAAIAVSSFVLTVLLQRRVAGT